MELCGRWSARLAFVGAAALVLDAAAAHVALPPLHPLHKFNFFDLRVYRDAARVVHSGRPLYSMRFKRGLGFTYPPFAALLLLPLTWMSLHHAELLVTLLNIVLTAVAVHAALRLPRRPEVERSGGGPAPVGGPAPAARSGGGSLIRRAASRLLTAGSGWGWLAAAAALWCEPITSTIGYGQIDLLIAALVTVDLARGSRGRLGGVGIGLAAAMKLTPLIFIPYLALTGRGRMAGRALGVFLLSILLSSAILPADSWSYWSGRFLNVSRVTGHGPHSGAGVANQSLRGMLLRVIPQIQHAELAWVLLSAVVAGVSMLLAARAARRGDELWGVLLTALAGLLISPVSWTHHWTIAVPALLALVVSNRRRPVVGAVSAGVELLITLRGYSIWPLIEHAPTRGHLPQYGVLAENPYVLAGLAAIALAAGAELWRTLPHSAREAALVGPEPSELALGSHGA